MRASASRLFSPLLAASLLACAGDNFAPSAGGGAAGNGPGGASGASGSGAAGNAGAPSAGQGGTNAGAAGSQVGGGAGSTSGGAGSTSGAAGSTSGGGGAAGEGGSGEGGAAGSAAGTAGSGGSASVGGSSGASGGGSAGAAGVAGSAGNGGAAGSGSITCETLFVRADAAGSDANTGCASTAPLRHLSAALARSAANASVKSIRLCAGSYEEGELVVSTPVHISGSWSCENAADWKLDESISQHDAKTKLDTRTATGIAFAGAAHRPGNSSLTRVEIAHAPLLSNQATGIHLLQGASPKLQFLNVHFPTANTANGVLWGSAALVIESGSDAEVKSNIFRAGPGSATAPHAIGSVGIGLSEPGPGFELRGNEIYGGAGITNDATQHGSAGIAVVVGTRTVYLSDNTIIDGGSGGTLAGASFAPLASVGILLRRLSSGPDATKVFVERTVVSGGKAGVCGLGCRTRGVFVQRFPNAPTAGDIGLVITEARVYGGDHSPTADSSKKAVYAEALRAENTKVVATSSVFHAGGLDQETVHTRAITLSGGRFEGNFVTVLPGKLRPEASENQVPEQGNAVGFWLQSPPPTVQLSDSLIVASDRQTFGIYGEGNVCTDGYTLSATRVRYVHTESASATPAPSQVGFFAGQSGDCPQGLKLDGKPAGASNQFMMTFADIGHVSGVMGPANPLPLQIVGCTTSSTCLPVVFPTLDDPANMRAAMLEAEAANLAPACNVGGGIDDGATTNGPRDLLTRPRNGSLRPMLGALLRPGCTP